MKGEDSLSQWVRIELLGQGGNGEVWKASRDGVECALKVLKETNKNEESYRRFIDEIRILRDLKGHPGVIPILDVNLPEHPSKRNRAWLAMPLATGIKKALGERPQVTNVVEAVASVARV
jgi:serine/threonine protein kinase